MNTNLLFIRKFTPSAGHIIASHSHSCLEISFFDTNCRGVVKIEDKSYNFSAGDIVIVEPHLAHSEVHESNGNLIFIGLECDSFHLKIVFLTSNPLIQGVSRKVSM